MFPKICCKTVSFLPPEITFLVFISIILELLHIVIPVRAFQIADLFGNFIGVILIISIYFIKNEFF